VIEHIELEPALSTRELLGQDRFIPWKERETGHYHQPTKFTGLEKQGSIRLLPRVSPHVHGKL